MKFLKYFLLTALIHGCSCAGAQTQGKQLEFNSAWGVDYKSNLIKNPAAYKNNLYATASGGTLIQDTTSGNKIANKASWKWTSTALNQTVTFTLIPISDELKSGACEFKGIYKGADGASYSAQILDGSSNVLSTVNLAAAPSFTTFSLLYPCGDTGARVPVIKQTTAGTPAALNFGVYYGPATNIGTVDTNKAYKVGSINASSCAGAWSTNATSASNFPVQTGCSYIVTGEVLAPSTMIPGFRLAYAKAGIYQLRATGSFVKSTANPGSSYFRFSDGTKNGQYNNIGLSASSDLASNIVSGDIEYTTDQTNLTIQIQGWSNSASINAQIASHQIDVYYIPNSVQSQPAVRQDLPIIPKTIVLTGSGTYTPAPGTSHIVVDMCGAGSGGSGSSTSSANAGSGAAGGTTTFGSSLLVTTGGGASSGPGSGSSGGDGGTFTVNSPAKLIIGVNGGRGSGANGAFLASPGLPGASGPFGGAGGGATNTTAGSNASFCSGGSGGGGNSSPVVGAGSSGGAGGYIKAQINFPTGSYPYSIGTGGTGGTAGTSGSAGGNGGPGTIIITEYYQLGSAVILPNMIPIFASYRVGVNQSVTNTSGALNFSTKIEDTHNAFSGNTFTAPEDGLYQYSIEAFYDTKTWAQGAEASVIVNANGVETSVGGVITQAAFGGPIYIPAASRTVPLRKGQTIVFSMYSSSATASVIPANTRSHFSIARVGIHP